MGLHSMLELYEYFLETLLEGNVGKKEKKRNSDRMPDHNNMAQLGTQTWLAYE